MNRKYLYILWAVLAVWMLLLAVGTSLYAPAPGAGVERSVDWRRGGMVVLMVGGFLGLWMILVTRKRLPRVLRDGLPVSDHRSPSIQSGQEQNGQQPQEDKQP